MNNGGKTGQKYRFYLCRWREERVPDTAPPTAP